MKMMMGLSLFLVSSLANANERACTDAMIITPLETAKLVTLSPKASEEKWEKAGFDVEVGANMDMDSGLMILSFVQDESMVCCQFSEGFMVVAGSERCVEAVKADGSRAKIQVSFLK